MKKITDFIKKNYIVFCIVVAIILVIIGSIIIIKLLNDNLNKIDTKKESYSFYEYFEEDKNEFKATLHYENERLVKVDSKDYNIYENSFIYYNDKNKIIIPKDMSIIFYNRKNLAYKLPKYSEIENDNNANIIYTGGKKYLNDDFFLYDGEDIYFFISDVSLFTNGEEIKLSKYSYIYARNDDLLYYNKEEDKSYVISDVSGSYVKVGEVKIDLLKDATVYNNEVMILGANLNNLPSYKED